MTERLTRSEVEDRLAALEFQGIHEQEQQALRALLAAWAAVETYAIHDSGCTRIFSGEHHDTCSCHVAVALPAPEGKT